MNILEKAIKVIESSDFYTDVEKKEFIELWQSEYNKRVSNAYVIDQIRRFASFYE